MYNANQPKSKCDIIVDEILSMIAKGVYKENEKLPPESYFIDYFGMSRVTVRESFKKLSMLGVVDIQQGVGTFVRKIDMGLLMKPLYSAVIVNNLNITQIFDARKYVEIGVTELAAHHLTDKQLSELRDLTKRMDEAIRLKDREWFSRLDMEFHEKLTIISNNSVLMEMYHAIKDTIEKYVSTINLSPGIIEHSEEQHKAILLAMASHDEKEAGRLMGEHVEDVKNRCLEMIERGELPAYIK